MTRAGSGIRFADGEGTGHTSPAMSTFDLAAGQTLIHAGDVVLPDAEAMPTEHPVAAPYRF